MLSPKTLHKNRAGGLAQGEGPEFKAQYFKNKKERKKESTVAAERVGSSLGSSTHRANSWRKTPYSG
jgi:hypothetical protein